MGCNLSPLAPDPEEILIRTHHCQTTSVTHSRSVLEELARFPHLESNIYPHNNIFSHAQLAGAIWGKEELVIQSSSRAELG